nr:TIGR03857 family LLM class F420-dependent oxidoreductase [Nocardioides convexus]
MGAVFLSERFNVKDAGVLAGAAAAATERIGIATAATNHNTRHPLVTATMASTLHRLSEGRYAFGLGRGFDLLFDVMGLPRVTGAQMRDAIGIYRRLWHGEAFGHTGPAGEYPYLSQGADLDEDVPVLMMAIGERSLRLAGQVADGVVLHTFLTDETLARSVATIRAAAEQAGRDPAAVRVWSVLATVDDDIAEEARLRKAGRPARDLPPGVRRGAGPRQRLVPGGPGALSRAPARAGLPGRLRRDRHRRGDSPGCARRRCPRTGSRRPRPGRPGSARAGSRTRLDAGADSVVLHGATPAELAGVVRAWGEVRDPARDALPANPGWVRR